MPSMFPFLGYDTNINIVYILKTDIEPVLKTVHWFYYIYSFKSVKQNIF